MEISEDGEHAITFDILTDITQFNKDKIMTLKMPIKNKITF